MEERCFGPIRFIPGKHDGRYPYCHSFFIESAGILIDPSSDRERLKQLRENPGVKAVWLTHWHEDHMKHLDLFDHIPLLISEADAPPLSDISVFVDWCDTPCRDHGRYWEKILKEKFHYKPRKPAGFLKGGQVIHLNDLTVDVLHTPGHTGGHLSFFFREPEVLFLGDYDLTPFGPWYGSRDSSIEDVISSVGRLKNMPAKVWLTSHETGIFEKDPGPLWDAYLAVIQEREDKLIRLLETPRTMEDIVEACIVYGRPREPEAFFKSGEYSTMKKHLERLMKNAVAIQQNGRYALSKARRTTTL